MNVVVAAQVKKLRPEPGDVVVVTGLELPNDPALLERVRATIKKSIPEGVHLWVFVSADADVRVVKPDLVVE